MSADPNNGPAEDLHLMLLNANNFDRSSVVTLTFSFFLQSYISDPQTFHSVRLQKITTDMKVIRKICSHSRGMREKNTVYRNVTSVKVGNISFSNLHFVTIRKRQDSVAYQDAMSDNSGR